MEGPVEKQKVLRLRAMKLRCAQDDTGSPSAPRFGLRSGWHGVVLQTVGDGREWAGGPRALQKAQAASFVPLCS